MIRNAEITLAIELVGVVVDAELLQTSPNHPELFGTGRRQQAGGIYGEQDHQTFHEEANGWNKQNGLHQ